MSKKKINDNIKLPTNDASLSQNKDDRRNMPAGSNNGAGQGAGKGSK